MSIIPYNHLMVYQNYYNHNKFNERKSILKQMLSFFVTNIFMITIILIKFDC